MRRVGKSRSPIKCSAWAGVDRVPGWVSQLDLYWEEPALARFLRRLATFARVIVFDRRGLGLSDRVTPGSVPTLDQRMDDIRAVLDDVGVQRAAVLGQGFGSPIALLFAATHPERTASLVLYSPAAKGGLRATDYPWGATAGQHEAGVERSTRMWGTSEFAAEWLARLAPTAAGDQRTIEWTARVLRAAGSPAAMRALSEMNAATDVRAILPDVRVATLVLVREAARSPKGGVDVNSVGEARWIAEDAECVVVLTPGGDYLPWAGDQDALIDEIEAFVTGFDRSGAGPRSVDDPFCRDLVRSTERVAEASATFGGVTCSRNTTRLFAGSSSASVGGKSTGPVTAFSRRSMPPRVPSAAHSPWYRSSRSYNSTFVPGSTPARSRWLAEGISGIAVHIGARVARRRRPARFSSRAP